MTIQLYQILLYLAVLILLTPLLGRYMAYIYSGNWRGLDTRIGNILLSPLRALENATYKILRVKADDEQTWTVYLRDVLLFNLFGLVVVFLVQVFQFDLPYNPRGLPNVEWTLALNTAMSFMTNTNWQAYAGETTLSPFVQSVALTVQNFVSAATGMAVLVALIRGLQRAQMKTVGSFIVDFTRSILYVLLPLSLVMSVLLMSQGVVQSYAENVTIHVLEAPKVVPAVPGATAALTQDQVVPLGPVASQEAIKQLGTNGGGYFNANSAHPLENPTPFSNFLEMLAILLIPSAMVVMFGYMVGSRKEGWAIWCAMMALFLLVLGLSLWSQYGGGPTLLGHRMILEGQELRFGWGNSVLWSTATTAASNGSVNAMMSSLSPLTGGLALLNILFGEIIFGGVGCGMYGMLMFVILTVFLAGLMVGRSPEYLGKKIEAREIQWIILAIIAPAAVILVLTGIATVLPAGLSSLQNKGPHGFTEIFYAFASGAGNNGSAFAGLNANTPFYNLTMSFAMFVGRFAVLIPALALAGRFVVKKKVPPSMGTFPTASPLFVFLLIGVIVITGALTFFPALTLGPIVEQMLMIQGRFF